MTVGNAIRNPLIAGALGIVLGVAPLAALYTVAAPTVVHAQGAPPPAAVTRKSRSAEKSLSCVTIASAPTASALAAWTAMDRRCGALYFHGPRASEAAHAVSRP